MLGPHLGPQRRVASAVALLLAMAASSACDEEVDPVDIPFDGLEPSAAAARPTVAPKPTGSASSSPNRSGGGVGQNRGGVDPNASAAAAVRTCCGSLSAAARSAKNEGDKAMNEQAARVCSRKVALVGSGKLTRAAALAQVRSSLLGPAPGTCR